ncbi:MAG: hypothetical protein R6U63_09190 [Longimicrobiales bacterium]
MSSAHDPIVSAEDAERLLGSLAGVVSAHVVTDAAGKIVEIHILSAADLHPKQMVRNVESALSAGLGIQIDRRVVSVAQIRAAADSNGHNPADPLEAPDEDAGRDHGAKADVPDRAPPRLEFVRYESHRDAEYCRCEVTLRNGEQEILGTGKGPDTAAGRAEAAARAVFDGIARARPQIRVELEAAVISSSRGRNFVIVAAHAVLVRTSIPLAGAASLTRSPEEAAILAALQATNRWSA